jgi:hypothetical protein
LSAFGGKADIAPQWLSHTFEISYTICEGYRVASPEPRFAPHPTGTPSSRESSLTRRDAALDERSLELQHGRMGLGCTDDRKRLGESNMQRKVIRADELGCEIDWQQLISSRP